MRILPLTLLVLAACEGSVTKDSTANDGTPAATPNRKPVADAGEPVSQTADSAVTLNASGSSDPDGDAITFHWSFEHTPSGSLLTSRENPFAPNHAAAAVTTSFQPDTVGTYVIKLVVEDSKGLNSDPDYVIITIEAPENIPVANAGTDQTVNVGGSASLDGSHSYDPLGRTLAYAWLLVDKPTSSTITTLTNADTVTPSFTPDVKGVYVASLVVNNGLAPSLADAVAITVLGDDSAPTANAGGDQTVEDCTAISLDCSSSADPDGDPLQYLWSIQTKPAASNLRDTDFSDRTAVRPTLYLDQAGTYTLSCTVSDGATWATPDVLTLTASERRSNTRPVADAGPDVSVSGGSAECTESGYTYNCDECSAQRVPLGDTATASDPDGDPVTAVWTVVEGDATVTDPNTLVTTVTLEDAEPEAPGECATTEYELQLEVTDCTGATSTDTITYTVECCGVEDSGP